jgi:flagellar basal body-associated protein FliL
MSQQPPGQPPFGQPPQGYRPPNQTPSPPGWQPPSSGQPPQQPPYGQPPGGPPQWPGQPQPPYGVPPGGQPGQQPYPPQYPPQQYQQQYAPPPPGYYGPPPKQKRSGFLGGLGIGCLIAIGLVVVAVIAIIVVVAAVANGASKAVATSTSFQDVHVPFANGSSGTVTTTGSKIHNVTIVSIDDNAKSTNQFSQPKAGNRFVAVQVLVENPGTSEISPGDWKLHATSGNEYDRTFVASVGQELPASSLTPGAKTQGTIVFEIPIDAKVQWVRYDPNTFAKGDLYFDAT